MDGLKHPIRGFKMKSKSQKFIPIFIGYDFRERAATNVLIDSLYQLLKH